MVNDQKLLSRSDTTPLTPETELDFHRGSEHLEPAPVYYGRKQETELARQAVEEAFGSNEYIAEGITQVENYANNGQGKEVEDYATGRLVQETENYTDSYSREKQQLQYIIAASQNISGANGARQYEVDTHWNLEDAMPQHTITQKISTAAKNVLTLLIGEKPAKNLFALPHQRHLSGTTERELIQKESEIGGQLFGKVAKDERREFFNLDPKTWVWYEETKTPDGKTLSTTTRYDVQEKGILKAQDGANYSYLEGEELQDFTLAVQLYYEQVMQKVYRRNPATGELLK